MSSSIFGGDRRVKGSKKKNSKKGTSSQLATKDLGRWKPVDDLALIIGVQQTNDLKMVHRGTKFSCKFTMNELQNRWYALLYEESVSRIAVAAMRNLHPELVENIQGKALYSNQEEELLATIKSVRGEYVFQYYFHENLNNLSSRPRAQRWRISPSCCERTRPSFIRRGRQRLCRRIGN